MEKILVSIPDVLAARLRAAIPAGQRSKVIIRLIEEEITKHEQQLYQSAMALEQDQTLKEEMADWDVTVKDGLEHE